MTRTRHRYALLKRTISAVALSLVLAMTMIGCGGSDGPRRASAPTSPTSVTPAEQSASRASALMPANGDAEVRNTVQDFTFPPRNEPFAFRSGVLEPKYRDQLRRPLQSSFVDIEGTIVWTQEYLRYRVNGCSHLDAISRVFSQIEGRGISPVCATVTGDAIFPPRNEPFDFRQRLEAKYRDELRRSPSQTAVDIEGDIVWTQEYLRYRVSGCSHQDAVDKVIAQIDGRGVQPACSTPPPPPPPGSCTYALLPASNDNVPTAGGTYTVNVSVQPGCTWRLASTVSWVALNTTGSGSAPISYRVDANPTGQPGRSGRLSLTDGSGREVAVHSVGQQGSTPPPCSYSISPTSVTLNSSASAVVEVVVTTQSGCAWSSSLQSSFLTYSAGGSGTGSGSVRIQVATNSATTSRTGTVRITWATGSQDVNITQPGATPLVANFTVSPQPCIVIGVGSTPFEQGLNSQTNCRFDAGTSTSSETITRYDWFVVSSQAILRTESGGRVITNVNFNCGTFSSGQATRDVTLTITTSSGATASRTIAVSFRKDSGC